jgi:hypothetical protein
LVAWHGQIGSTSVNVSIGNNSLVYWTPLSWGEAYYPSYSVSANFWRVINRPYVHHTYEYAVRPPRNYEYRNWRAPGGATAVEAAVIANARPVASAVRAMAPLPTTQQAEAISIFDRVKPMYDGAANRVGAVPVQAAPRAAPIGEAAVRAMPPASSNAPQVNIPSYTPPGRAQPQAIPTQPAPQTTMPAAPVVREQAVVPPQQPMQPPLPQRAAPQQAIPTQPAPQAAVVPAAPIVREQAVVPSRPVSVPTAQMPVVQQPALPTQPAVPSQQDSRRVAPTQNRGEAQPARPVQPFVEPVIRTPRAVAPQAVAPIPTQPAPQERSRRAEDRPGERDKSQRQ